MRSEATHEAVAASDSNITAAGRFREEERGSAVEDEEVTAARELAAGRPAFENHGYCVGDSGLVAWWRR